MLFWETLTYTLCYTLYIFTTLTMLDYDLLRFFSYKVRARDIIQLLCNHANKKKKKNIGRMQYICKAIHPENIGPIGPWESS